MKTCRKCRHYTDFWWGASVSHCYLRNKPTDHDGHCDKWDGPVWWNPLTWF